MKKYGIGKGRENSEATKKAFEELVDMAHSDPDAEVTVFLFDPEKHIIISKETPYILVILGLVAGYLGAKLAQLL